MVVLIVSLIVLLTAALTVPGQPGFGCDQPTFKDCEQKFNDYLGITDGTDWTDPDKLQRELLDILVSGEEGIIKVCGAWTKMAQCLGSHQELTCFSVLSLLQHGVPYKLAMHYVGIFNQFRFICGAGFIGGLNNWHCIAQTLHLMDDNGTMTKCYSDFEDGVNSAPAEDCYYSKRYLQCVAKPFYDGCNAVAGFWGCNYARYAIESQYYHCGEALDCVVHPDFDFGGGGATQSP